MPNPLVIFVNIKQAALEIAYDNSSADTTEMQIAYLVRVNDLLRNLPFIKLIVMNNWLGGLLPNDLSVVCAGEENEMQEVMATAPDREFAHQIFDEMFLC